MSAIAGFWEPSARINKAETQNIIQKMSISLSHRGPDGEGYWIDPEVGVALGHRRLAVLDLSQKAQQPMRSVEGRYVISLDGMIYNFAELQQELTLLGHQFISCSVAAVMLASFSQWGLTKAVQRFDGMFAFALWDRQERILHLARDRMGEKSLYYGWFDGVLIFASELKALKLYPKFRVQISRDALTLLLRHRSIPAPYSIYEDVYKLTPGTILNWDGVSISNPKPYWSLKEAITLAVNEPFKGSEQDATRELEILLKDVIKKQMVADVPVGAFLSGGIDSSTVAAIMQSQSSQPIDTFSIGFYEDVYNEAQYAKAIAQHLGTNHTELYIGADDALVVIPKLPTMYDEPFADPSQIPTFLAAQMAKKQVGVSLMGDGGDELFVGADYSYTWSCNVWRAIRWIPLGLREAIAGLLLKTVSNDSSASKILGGGTRNSLLTIADFVGSHSIERLYTRLRSCWKQPASVVINGREPLTIYTNPQAWFDSPILMQHLLYIDAMTDLPDNNFVKVDRACMSAGLEPRMPLLDRRLMEFAWRLPMSMKIKNDAGKRVLRRVLYKYVPQRLVDRPKQGFGIPIHSWLREPLRDWAEALLDENRLKDEGFFRPEPIRQEWHTHTSGKGDRGFYLWDILMFQAWLEQNR